MDSRIREALEKIEALGTHDTLEGRSLIDGSVVPSQHIVTNFAKIAREALALLTAEPEPCEDAEGVAEAIEQDLCGIEGEPGQESVIIDIPEAGRLIEAFASRLVQEAREDERRRCAEDYRYEVEKEVRAEFAKQAIKTVPALTDALDGWIRAGWSTKHMATDLLAFWLPDRSAILQGTEPAKYAESDEDRDERLLLKQELGAGCHDEMRYDEPAKVSEDVERDTRLTAELLSGIAYQSNMHTPEGYEQMTRDMQACFVSRIKEGINV